MARPPVACRRLPILSVVSHSVDSHSGTSNGSAFCHCRSSVTTNVPLVMVPPAHVGAGGPGGGNGIPVHEADTTHVPPPVTTDDWPFAAARKVPEPVNVMNEHPALRAQSVAIAVAAPWGSSVHGNEPPGPVH